MKSELRLINKVEIPVKNNNFIVDSSDWLNTGTTWVHSKYHNAMLKVSGDTTPLIQALDIDYDIISKTHFTGSKPIVVRYSIFNDNNTGSTFNVILGGVSGETRTTNGTYEEMFYVKNIEPGELSAGDDQIIYTKFFTGSTILESSANPTGFWSIESGTGGTISDINVFNAVFTGTLGSNYLLYWNVGLQKAEVNIGVDCYIQTATALTPNYQDGDTIYLEGNEPEEYITGTWSIISGAGGSFVDDSLYNTQFNYTSGVDYVIKWTLTSPNGCSSFVNIQVSESLDLSLYGAAWWQFSEDNYVDTPDNGYWEDLTGNNHHIEPDSIYDYSGSSSIDYITLNDEELFCESNIYTDAELDGPFSLGVHNATNVPISVSFWIKISGLTSNMEIFNITSVLNVGTRDEPLGVMIATDGKVWCKVFSGFGYYHRSISGITFGEWNHVMIDITKKTGFPHTKEVTRFFINNVEVANESGTNYSAFVPADGWNKTLVNMKIKSNQEYLIRDFLVFRGLFLWEEPKIRETLFQNNNFLPKSDKIVFEEYWNAGFTGTSSNDWSFDPSQGNWGILNNYVRFTDNPRLYDYNFSLVSKDINLLNESNIRLSYDIYLQDFSQNSKEYMTVELWDGSVWQNITGHTNSGNIAWTTFEHDINTFSENNIIKIRFRASGEDSYFITQWRLDNIKIISDGEPIY